MRHVVHLLVSVLNIGSGRADSLSDLYLDSISGVSKSASRYIGA
jgi:hypothetical protein